MTTFRKNGIAVTTFVWFVLDEGTVYVWTPIQSGKVKRIRANPRVKLAPCDIQGKSAGPEVEAMAELLPREQERIPRNLFAKKYGVGFRLARSLSWLGRERR